MKTDEELIKEFQNFIKNSPEKSFPKFNIKIHPSTTNYKKQKRFEKNIINEIF